MIESKKMHWTESGDPVWTITVTGIHDVYRFAHHLTYGQVEFCELGHRGEGALKRKLSKEGWTWLMDYMHGKGG